MRTDEKAVRSQVASCVCPVLPSFPLTGIAVAANTAINHIVCCLSQCVCVCACECVCERVRRDQGAEGRYTGMVL